MSFDARVVIAIKRKAEDEPLDVLCVDDTGTASPRKKRQLFRRVLAHGSTTVDWRSPGRPVVPSIQTETTNGHDVPNLSVPAHSAPRRFHLLRHQLPASPRQDRSRSPANEPKRASQLVIFAEQRAEDAAKTRAIAQERRPKAEPLVARKRPQLSQSTRLWHQKSQSSLSSRSRDVSPHPGIRHPTQSKLSRPEIESLRWALELQSLNAQEQQEDSHKSASTTKQLPAKSTSREIEPDAEDGWVYDRYVQCVEGNDAMDVDASEAEVRDTSRLGYLIIGSEDEKAWEAYLNEAQGSPDDDGDGLGDDDDSNAEDYYANDYPDEDSDFLVNSGSDDDARDGRAFDSDYDLNDPEFDVGFSDDEAASRPSLHVHD